MVLPVAIRRKMHRRERKRERQREREKRANIKESHSLKLQKIDEIAHKEKSAKKSNAIVNEMTLCLKLKRKICIIFSAYYELS